MKIDDLPRCKLSQLPTPVQELKKLSKALGGPTLLVKRDDQTGLALGGNKVRKLEFLVADALAQKADTLITLGGAQSNHCRQTAAAAAVAGLRCELILNGKPPENPNGNLFLDTLFGAKIHWIDRSQRASKGKEISEQLMKQGKRPYLIPVGGSNGLGACGYVAALSELFQQLEGRKIDHIVFASSSGGTQAGLVLGARLAGFNGGILGIGIDKDERDLGQYEQELADIANDAAARIGVNTKFSPDDFKVVRGYAGAGYGVVGTLEREAIRMVAQEEGLLVDPVYTGRAIGALFDLIRKGRFRRDETVLFWHTGGAPALFAYTEDLR